jgi:hypothetical protein
VPLDSGPPGDVEFFVDNGIVECSLCGGTVWVTMLFFPSDTAGKLAISTLG